MKDAAHEIRDIPTCKLNARAGLEWVLFTQAPCYPCFSQVGCQIVIRKKATTFVSPAFSPRIHELYLLCPIVIRYQQDGVTSDDFVLISRQFNYPTVGAKPLVRYVEG